MKTRIQAQACTSVYIPSQRQNTKDTSPRLQARSKATDPTLGPNASSGTPTPTPPQEILYPRIPELRAEMRVLQFGAYLWRAKESDLRPRTQKGRCRLQT